MKLRMIRNEDIKGAQAVYKPFVKNTPITFEYNVPSYKKFVKRVEKICETYPWIVAEVDGEVAGYAYATRFKERMAFTWDAETYIYVAEQSNNRGIGSALYAALEEILKMQGFYNMYAMITDTAKNSIAFHEKMGYRQMYTLEKSAWKFDQWYGMICMEKKIGNFDETPEPIIPVRIADTKAIEQILDKYSTRF